MEGGQQQSKEYFTEDCCLGGVHLEYESEGLLKTYAANLGTSTFTGNDK